MADAKRASSGPSVHAILLAGALAALAVAVLVSAWVSDDALITLRTIDQLLHGHGLRFNPAERVQAFTHPLWLLVVTPFQAMTGEGLWATFWPSLLCTAGAVFFVVRAVWPGALAAWVAVFALVSSKAFVDYSTSGLENPLTHLLLALFAWRLFAPDGAQRAGATTAESSASPKRAGELALVAALVFTNRMDAVLMVAPTSLWLAVSAVRGGRFGPSMRAALLGALPALLWLAFAWLYFGSMLPNTAQAKLATGIDRAALVAQGLRYLVVFADLDPAGAVALASGVLVGAASRDVRARVWAAGAALYVLYVVWIGGDFMAGRFLAAPVCMAAVALGRATRASETRWCAQFSPIAAGACVLLAVLSPWSPLRASTDDVHVAADPARAIPEHGIVDERLWYYTRTGVFSSHREGGLAPEAECTAPAGAPGVVRVRRLCGGLGRVAFEGCRADHWIDPCGLTDGFLARRPLPPQATWRIGHFARPVPAGYGRSVESGVASMNDPVLDAAFEETLLRTRAPLLDPARLALILAHPLGGSSHAHAAPAARPGASDASPEAASASD